MSIVMNEYEWAERAIFNRDLGKKPTETLTRVAKYYIQVGYSKQEIRKLLETFLVQCDPSASLVRWSEALDRIAKNADKFPLIQLNEIRISKPELKKIADIHGVQVQRLAFTLLCVAKYWDAVSDRNNHWVNSQDGEIMQMANIKTSIKRQSLMFASIRDAGLIKFSKKVDNLNVQVLFIEPGETFLDIHDFRNLGYQYMRLYGGQYYDCANCGITLKTKTGAIGRPPKYCPNCAVELGMKRRIESAMRHKKNLISES